MIDYRARVYPVMSGRELRAYETRRVRTAFRTQLRLRLRTSLPDVVNATIEGLCATAARGDAVRSRHALEILLDCLYPRPI